MFISIGKAEQLKEPTVEKEEGGRGTSEPEEESVSRSPVRNGEKKPESEMCSVVGCDSYRRSAQRLKLPEEPDRRQQWVQFLLKVNGQQLKESSWTDVTICSEHFTQGCFLNTNPEAGALQLSPGAVPTQHIKPEAEEPAKSPKLEPGETSAIQTPFNGFKLHIKAEDLAKSNGFVFILQQPDKSGLIKPQILTPLNNIALHASTFSCSGTSQVTAQDAAPSCLVPTQQKELTPDVNQKISGLLQTKGKFVVNEKCLFQLLGRKCPSCGSKLQIEKVTYEAFLVMNQRCLKCSYSNQWKNIAGAKIPTAEDRDSSGNQQVPAFNSTVVSEIVVFSDEESDSPDDAEESEEDDDDSTDGEWDPTAMDSEFWEEEEEEEKESSDLQGGFIRELCTECGSFFDKRKQHTCVHKVRPFPCNICGKRCLNEFALKIHSRIHQDSYESRCKYCHVSFKTRLDKLEHEESHQNTKNPYHCPDCPQKFATHKERSAHLFTHRGPNEHKCGVCGIVFNGFYRLERHSVVHTGLKSHKCSVCDRSFNQQSHLKSHMRLHTGERPYKCRHCDKSFNHNVSLKSHVQQHHRHQESSAAGSQTRVCHDAKDGEKDPDVQIDGAEEEDPKEEAKSRPKRKRSSGRPIGRPKKSAAESSGQAAEENNSNTVKPKRKSKASSDEESQDDPSDGNLSFESAEEDEEIKKHRSLKKRPEHDSDSDFNPEREEEEEETKLKKSSGRSSGKPRGRPRKNVVV